MNPSLMRVGAAALLALAVFLVAYVAARRPPAAPSSLGHRGLQRQQALERSFGFRLLEPPVRWLSSWLARWPMRPLRARLQLELTRSGDYLGLNADELIALTLVSGGLAGFVGGRAGAVFARPLLGVLGGLVLGSLAPYLRVRERRTRRDRQLSRALPATIDLVSLCMSAGLDFGSALQLVTRECPARDAVLQHELQRILQGLQTGQTRREALLAFAARTSAACVRDFVGAVVQADAKGTPLSAVLEIQAQLLRMHRSVLAEEAAARAGVLLVLPLLLLLGCILLVMLGPFIVSGIGL